MTETNVQLRQPAKLDYASPIQFRFKCTKLPEVEFTCQTANIPGISLGGATQPTPLVDVPIPGDKINYDSLDITFIVDENLTTNNAARLLWNFRNFNFDEIKTLTVPTKNYVTDSNAQVLILTSNFYDFLKSESVIGK